MNVFADLKDKVALITGGGSGIGLGAARQLSAQGVKVALLGRSLDKLRACAKEFPQALAVQADVSSAPELERAVKQVVDEWGRLDIVVANAGINGVWAPLEEITPKEWEATLSVNLTGTFLTVRACLPELKKQSSGSIIITSSVNGTRMFSNTGATAYACSKAGQVAFAKMLALELAPHKIRVNVVCPGWIESEIEERTEKRNIDTIRQPVEFPRGAVPLTKGGPGSADQVGSTILFLASSLASHVTGTEMWVDGAQSLVQG